MLFVKNSSREFCYIYKPRFAVRVTILLFATFVDAPFCSRIFQSPDGVRGYSRFAPLVQGCRTFLHSNFFEASPEKQAESLKTIAWGNALRNKVA